ncbi:ATP-binding protein [Epilithonimonas sp.]|uniref:ATP-binding protein n=1 Tax=Epilithonimonas sp. TaxID=2894511 RepID=UPI0035B04A51
MKTVLYIKNKIESWLLHHVCQSRNYPFETSGQVCNTIAKLLYILNWVFIFIYLIFGFYWATAFLVIFVFIEFISRNIRKKHPFCAKASGIQSILIFIFSSSIYGYSKQINLFYIIYILLSPLIFTYKESRLLIFFTIQSIILFLVQPLVNERHFIHFNLLRPEMKAVCNYLIISNLIAYVYIFTLSSIILNIYYTNKLKGAIKNFNILQKKINNNGQELKVTSDAFFNSSFKAPINVNNNFFSKIKNERDASKAKYYINLLKERNKLNERFSADLNTYLYVLHLKCIFHQINLKRLIDSVSKKLVEKYKSAEISNEIEITVVLRSHETLLKIIIENLIENGIQYNISEKPVIRIFYESRDNVLSIYFKDNGIGIKEEHKENIFNPFMRINETEIPGRSGLGLTIARLAALKINADLSLISNTDGCIFRLKTPDALK